jgi:hypothetical protein
VRLEVSATKTNQPVSAVYVNSRCLLWNQTEHTNTLWAECRILVLKLGGTDSNHWALKIQSSYFGVYPSIDFIKATTFRRLVLFRLSRGLKVTLSRADHGRFYNVRLQHPVALRFVLCRLCATSVTLHLFFFIVTTCFGLTGHLQVYRLLWCATHCNAVLLLSCGCLALLLVVWVPLYPVHLKTEIEPISVCFTIIGVGVSNIVIYQEELIDAVVTHHKRIRELFVSNLGRDTGYPAWCTSWLSSVLPGKYLDSASIMSRPLRSKSYLVYHSWFLLTLHMRYWQCQ